MEHKAKYVLILAATLAALGLAGFVGVSYAISQDDPIVTHHPNDRANHHPLHEAN
ncbi:MAG TPA: hypothetical protein VGF43_00530 [Dongiaceae bacterium]